MTTYAKHLTNRRETPQSEVIPGEKQVENNAGGYVFEVDKWQRLTRFLILGSDGGTYYVKERALTRDNAKVVEACLADDAVRTVAEIVSVSDGGRAPKNDAAVFALALAAASPNYDTRSLAYGALPKVCRIPTHLFQFLETCKALRGWSRGLRTAVGKWYAQWPEAKLAYELVKYQSRGGWSNRDAFRLSHLGGGNTALLRWAIGAPTAERTVTRTTRKEVNGVTVYAEVQDQLPAIVAAFEEAKAATTDWPRVVELIREHGLTREMVPTQHLNEAAVWNALLEKMPLTAMVRSLAKMTAVGLLVPMSDASKSVTSRLTEADYIRKSRLHPMAVLNALRVYQSGHGDKGSLTWKPVREVVDALDAAFYLAFGNVTPTGKRLMLALDVSGSMSAGIAGTGLSCREAAAAMALVTMNVEPSYVVTGFTSGRSGRSGYSNAISELTISPRQRLDDVVRYIDRLTFGGTDCALPMLYALKQQLDLDAFLVFTDSETWAGTIHPKQALRKYRDARVPTAGQVVVGMTATEFSIADPADPRTLDVVGFDLATPQAISEFISGLQ